MKAGCLITSAVAFVYACTPPVVPAATVDLRDEVIGRSPRYIGAVEGGKFSVPFMADCGINTDGGGTGDLAELHDGTDPRDAPDDLDGDWDGDGLTSRDELEQYHTDPRNDDHDADSLDDGEEILIFLTSATSPDSDNDGYSDYIEAKCGWDTREGAPSGGVRVNFQPAVNSKNPSGFCVDDADSRSPRGYGWI